MADLIVGPNAILSINGGSALLPAYDVFRMEDNSSIVTDVDIVIKARRAEFGANCTIMASGSPGINAPVAPLGAPGSAGGAGGAGHSVTIEAGLARVGSLTIVTDGGPGGAGGHGAFGVYDPADMFGTGSSTGGGSNGGMGGNGGNAGQIVVRWTPRTSALAGPQSGAPTGHTYRSSGGAGGSGGPAGVPGPQTNGPPLSPGALGPNGLATVPRVEWIERTRTLLWVQKQDMGPAPRFNHSLCWDAARKRFVLFGGAEGPAVGGQVFGDTWEWDGHLWIQVNDIGPSARSLHGSAFDPVNRQTLLFGGLAEASAGTQPDVTGDTWSWDGRDWIQIADSGPSPRASFAMASDPIRRCVVLFGGTSVDPRGTAQGLLTQDTWEWDGTQWIQRDDSGPSARRGAKMAFDWSTDRIVLFGGADPLMPEETWTWDGNAWAQVADTGPRGRVGHSLCSDGMGVTLFGGLANPAAGLAGGLLGDTWSFRDERWRQIQDIGPSHRAAHEAAFEEDAEHIILFGGGGETAALRDTWYLVERLPRVT